MKAYWTPIIFAAGLGTGLLISSGGMRESAETAENKSAAPVVTKREARPGKTPHEAKFRTFAKELPKLSAEEQNTFKKSLAPGDRAAAIEALLAQAGPQGISGETNLMIFKIVNDWTGEDFDGAWAWCQRIESDANRKFVAMHLLYGLADKDPERALALHLEMAAEDPNFVSNVPLAALKLAASKDAASFLDILGKLPIRTNGNSGSGMDFAADFNFQHAADGLTAFRNSHGGSCPTEYPSNFLSTWAARDADAAYAWFSKDPRAVRFENFGSLLQGIEKQGVPGASYPWAADKLNESGTARDAMVRSLAHTISDNLSSTIHSIAQAMPDTVSSDRFLGDVLTKSTYAEPAIMLGYALTQMSTPAARLETLRQLGTKGRLDSAKIPDAQLQQWGLTRQQVEQLQPSGR